MEVLITLLLRAFGLWVLYQAYVTFHHGHRLTRMVEEPGPHDDQFVGIALGMLGFFFFLLPQLIFH